jgi:hypothetical protein
MSLAKSDSQLADKDSNPLIGPAQDAITDVDSAGATYAQAEVNAIVTGVNAVLAALREHGLIKE